MCLIVQVVWQVKHCGCGSCFSMKEWVSLVIPIRNRDITTCSLLDFLDAGLHSPKVGWIWKSLLWLLWYKVKCWIVLFDPYIEPHQVLSFRVKVDLGMMAMKGYSTFPKAPGLKSRHQIILYKIHGTLWWVGLIPLQPKLTWLYCWC